jgi:glycosyltransferase involved in cell wall biosynthesis
VISFIIPAHDEEALIGQTLSALHESAQALGEPYEIVVANDASTDRTEAVAVEHGAHVVAVNRRQIAAARNAGAHAATGNYFIFVDADTVVTAQVLRAALRALRGGAVGGGCAVRLDGRLPVYAAILMRLLPPLLHAFGLAAGCFLFCTRQAFLTAGGFNETLYAGEEVAFGQRLKRQGRLIILRELRDCRAEHGCLKGLKRQGRLIILREFVISSGRKLRARTTLQFVGVAVRLALGGSNSLRRREGLEYWYGPRESLC